MDQYQTRDTIKNKSKKRVVKSEIYKDDNFFNDVPLSGTLTKSLVALNKYVKKNLFYDDSDESNADEDYIISKESPIKECKEQETYIPKVCKEDDAYIANKSRLKEYEGGEEDISKKNNLKECEIDESYFSKENSPNNSVTKWDTDSIKSDVSVDKQETLSKINDNDTHDRTTVSTERNNNNIENKHHILTDDYKIKSLHLNDILSDNKLEDSNRDNNQNIDHQIQHTHDDNLITNCNEKKHSEEKDNDDRVDQEYETIQQTRSSDTISDDDDRHSLYDSTEWANRMNMYPDVYTPLPYKSPRRYVESDVNIHYRCPVRHDPLPLVPERELARQQAEHMKRLYREQKRNKYLQELQDMQNRRHQDNFTPSQKNILPLNRYDEAEKIVARALYAFNGQTSRELSFRKGDFINVRRQIDANWYEGEVHGRIGLFPYNYVEIMKGDVAQSPKKPILLEGRARAKFDFIAQTNLELPLKKGEVVVLTRRIDQNWWEGRNGNRTGIFPDSYVTVLQEPSANKPEPQPILSTDKPVASPAAHGLVNGTAKRSMGAHSYLPQPNSPALSNAPPATQPLPGYVAKPAQVTQTPSERGYGPPSGAGVDLNNTEPLYVDTNAEAVPYRAMYKYRPQNPDELELNEGDTVYVLEKCDDGWYVGSSQRTGRFGTFPGNYVERI